MHARRLLRLFATRWWLVLLVALAGGATAYLVTDWQNEQIAEEWEARAPVLILRLSTEDDDAYERRLRNAEAQARAELDSVIRTSPNLRIEANVPQAQLEFVAVASTETEAIAEAASFKARYETASPGGDLADQLRRRLNSLEADILVLRAKRADLLRVTPLDPDTEIAITVVETNLSTLRQRAAALSLGIEFPELGTAVDAEGLPRSGAELRVELFEVQNTIERLQARLDQLRAEYPGLDAVDETLDLDVLVVDQQIRDAESAYIATALEIEDLLSGGPSVASTTTSSRPITDAPSPPERATIIGFVLGALVAAAVIIATDRMRRPILGIEDDLPIPILATVDPSRPGADSGQPWYPSAGNAPRRADIQGLRASLEGTLEQGTVAIGLAGAGASDGAVQELAADLSASLAVSGRDALLVDAVFEHPSDLPEYGTGGVALADLVTHRTEAEDAREDLKIALGDREPVMPDLVALRAGELDRDSVDAVAGRRFRELLEVAHDFADVTVIAAPQWGHRATDAKIPRLDLVLLVGRTGVTTVTELDDIVADLQRHSMRTAGLVLLNRRSWFRRFRAGRTTSTPSAEPVAAEASAAPVKTTFVLPSSQPGASGEEAKGIALHPADASTDLIDPLPREITTPPPVATATVASVAEDLLDPAEAASSVLDPDALLEPTDGREPGEGLLLDHVAGLVRQGIDHPPIDGHPAGTLLLLPDRHAETAASLLYASVFRPGSERPAEVDASLSRVIGDDPSHSTREDVVAGLDWWLRGRLVEAQEGMDGPVRVRQLSSRLGTFRALVDAESFDSERAEELRAPVRRMLERLRIDLWRQTDEGPGQALAVRTRISDVEDFDLALHELSGGTPGVPLGKEQLNGVGVLASNRPDG